MEAVGKEKQIKVKTETRFLQDIAQQEFQRVTNGIRFIIQIGFKRQPNITVSKHWKRDETNYFYNRPNL